MLENGVLRKKYGPKRKEVTGEGRRLCNKELYDLYSSANIIRVITSRSRRAGHVACMGNRRCAYGVLVGRPEGKRPLGRHGHRWEDNIKVDLKEVGWTGLMWLRIGTGGGCF